MLHGLFGNLLLSVCLVIPCLACEFSKLASDLLDTNTNLHFVFKLSTQLPACLDVHCTVDFS